MAKSSHRINKVKTHISLPEWLKEQSEAHAALRGYTMSELATKLYERWLEEEKQRIAHEQRSAPHHAPKHGAGVTSPAV